jgi:Protein of unknown function (DUF5818)
MKKALALFAMASISAFAAEITGFVGDASCGAKHADASAASAACAERCTKRGDAPVLVTKDAKVYKIDKASTDKLSKFIGKTVTVTGSVADDTITIESVK